jgi:hypothetical protein
MKNKSIVVIYNQVFEEMQICSVIFKQLTSKKFLTYKKFISVNGVFQRINELSRLANIHISQFKHDGIDEKVIEDTRMHNAKLSHEIFNSVQNYIMVVKDNWEKVSKLLNKPLLVEWRAFYAIINKYQK